jgi:cell division protein FtsI/penicillin-binding protein 2
MGSLGNLRAAWVLSILFLSTAACLHAQSGHGPRESLFAQSAADILKRDYAQPETSYLLLDANSGAVLASHWDDYEKPIPVGSLVKPFTALAYASAHGFRYPLYECKGRANGCWQDQPHGKLDITAAVAVSCNAYFLQMAEAVTFEQLMPIARAYRIEPPDANSTPSNLIGLGQAWRISPIHLAQAYLELFRRRNQPGVSRILEGMRLAALEGTGAAVDRRLDHAAALVKTGTAVCTHSPRAPTDGFVLVLVPAKEPEILLLMRVHGVAGATAAESAGQALHQMQE